MTGGEIDRNIFVFCISFTLGVIFNDLFMSLPLFNAFIADGDRLLL